jgi:hypothetical protein
MDEVMRNVAALSDRANRRDPPERMYGNSTTIFFADARSISVGFPACMNRF